MKKLVRPQYGRLLGGVCRGIAQYFHIDTTFVRGMFLVLFVMGGFPGLFVYLLLWMVIPSEKSFSQA